MSQPVVDFGSNANWSLVFDELRQATAVTERDFIPIPAFELGFLFDSPILAVRTISTTAKAKWKFAGEMSCRLRLGSGGATSSLPTVTAAKRSLRLNRAELHRFISYTQYYELLVEPAYWLQDLRLTIWQYKGAIGDTTEELIETIKIDVLRVEGKIDTLFNLELTAGFNNPRKVIFVAII